MATTKVTVTLDLDQVQMIKQMVAEGNAPSVSGFVQHAVDVALDDVVGWAGLLAQALTRTGGPLTESERLWADGVLGLGDDRPGNAA